MSEVVRRLQMVKSHREPSASAQAAATPVRTDNSRPDSLKLKEEKALEIAKKRGFLELRPGLRVQLEEKYREWSAARQSVCVVLRHRPDYSVISVSMPYKRVASLRQRLLPLFSNGLIERSTSRFYALCSACPSRKEARTLAKALAQA